MDEYTELAGTGMGAVCAKRDGQTWPKQMINLTRTDTHQHTHSQRSCKSRHPTLVRFVIMKKYLLPWKIKKKGFPWKIKKKGSRSAQARA